MAIDAAAFGIDSALLSGQVVVDKKFAVWSENIEALDCFLSCKTQWRMLAGATGAVFTGLDYQGVKVVLKSRKIKDWRTAFTDIQVMESAALEVFNAA